MGYGVKA